MTHQVCYSPFYMVLSWKKGTWAGTELKIILNLESELVNSAFYQTLHWVASGWNESRTLSGTCLQASHFIRNLWDKWVSQVALLIKNPPVNAGDKRDMGSVSGSGRPLEEGMATHSSILAGESWGQRTLASYSAQGRKESDTTEATWHARVHRQGW